MERNKGSKKPARVMEDGGGGVDKREKKVM